MIVLPEDSVSCESCMTNIVCGDECSNGQEILCLACFEIDSTADQQADEMMRQQMAHSQQGVQHEYSNR